MKRNKRFIFEIIVYVFVILAGAFTLFFNFVTNTTLAWILITLGSLNLIATLWKKY